MTLLRVYQHAISSPMRLLIIEDDPQTAGFIVKGLSQAGHVIDHAATGPQGLGMALEGAYDALIIDRMLPGMDGLSVIETLRSEGRAVPVLILSALSQVDDRVRGLKTGGDDYLTKPFAFSELEARLEALLRRGRGEEGIQTRFSVGDLELDILERRVTRQGKSIPLQPREFKLLEFLMRHAGQVVTRTMLLEGVWDYHFDPQTNVIDVHISRLRGKIDKGFDAQLLHTVRDAGYSIRAPR